MTTATMKTVNIAGVLHPSQPDRIEVGSHIRYRMWNQLQYLRLHMGKRQDPQFEIVGVVTEIEMDGDIMDITVKRDDGKKYPAGFPLIVGGSENVTVELI